MKTIIAAFAIALAACTVAPPVSPSMDVPSDGAAICAHHCETMHLELSSVVLMGNQMGCVCAPPSAAMPGPPGAVSRRADDGGVAVAAGALLARQEAERQAAQQSRNNLTHAGAQ